MDKTKNIVFGLPFLVILGFLIFNYDENHEKEVFFDDSRWGREFVEMLEKGPSYLPSDFPLTLAPPPNLDKVEEELAYLRMITGDRTYEEEKLINSQIDDAALYFFERAGIDSASKPATVSLMKEVIGESAFFILREKKRFRRARPYDLDPSLNISISPPPHPSYPSGHASQSWALAILLSRLDPEREKIWFDAANIIGRNRELAGVHYPSDTRAGQNLAEQIMPALFANPEFSEKLKLAKEKEWSTR